MDKGEMIADINSVLAHADYRVIHYIYCFLSALELIKGEKYERTN